MRSTLLCLVVFASCQACQPAALSGVDTRWTVTPEALEFGSVFVGSEGTAVVIVRNESRSSLELAVAVAPPFAVSASHRLEGGASTTLEVRVRPTEPGDFTSTLSLSDGARVIEVPVHATGRAVPDCGAASTCHAQRFDPARGACVDEVLPDGTSCASTCLTAATCQGGVCMGSARDCDDRNACTADSCDERLGCLHDAVTCAPSTNPCLAAVCDPRVGCALEPVTDGTSCGPNDCTTAHVCIAGTCEARVSPDGSECAPAEVCRAASVCENQRCVQGAMTPPVARWTHAPQGKRVFFEGTVSPDGIAYFTEASIADPLEPLELVGIDERGVERLRVVLEPNCPNCSARLALDPYHRLVFAGRRGTLQARDTVDGGLRWSRDSASGKGLRSPMADGGGLWSTSALLSLGADDLIVQQLTEGYDLHREYSIAVDRRTGAVAWERDWWGHVYFPAVTGSNELFITNADCWAPIQQSVSLGREGQTERSVARQARPIGVDRDRVLLAGTDVVWSTPNGLSAPLPVTTRNPSWVLTSPGRDLIVGDSQSISAVDEDAGTRWVRRAGSVQTGALIEDGGALFSEYTTDGGSLLHRLAPDGTERFTCALPGYANVGALHRGLYVVPLSRAGTTSVAAFEVGPIDLAKTGWVMPNGSPRNDRHPLPVLPYFVR